MSKQVFCFLNGILTLTIVAIFFTFFSSIKYTESQIFEQENDDYNLLPRDNGDMNYNITGISGDGLFSYIYMGSTKKRVIFSIDTSFSSLLVNNYTYLENLTDKEEALSGFNIRSSSTFRSALQPFNVSAVDDGYAAGVTASDYIYFGSSRESKPLPVTFGLSLINSINKKNKNVVGGRYPKIVADLKQPANETLSDDPVFPANILGLAMPDSENSLITQLVNLGVSKTSLFSIYTEEDGTPHVLFGAVDTSQYKGQLAMTPILKSKMLESAEADYHCPFVMLTGVSLTNNEHEVRQNLSSAFSHVPTLLNPNTLMSYLPYNLLVELASEFGAFYSSELSIWIQDCSLQNLNGSIGFKFYDKTIEVPLKNLFVPLVNFNGDRLFLTTGKFACAMAFYPAETRGYSCLGSAFFQDAYVLFDYTNKYVGLAQSKTSGPSSFDATFEDEDFSQYDAAMKSSDMVQKVIVVNNDVGQVVNVTTMTGPSSEVPTATISSPSEIKLNRTTDFRSMSFNPNALLSVSPTEILQTAFSVISNLAMTTSITPNANAVSVKSGVIFSDAASSVVPFPQFYVFNCMLAICILFTATVVSLLIL